VIFTKGHKAERSVSAGDEEVDGGVVEDLEEALYAGFGKAVIEGRGEVENDESGAKDASADDGPRVGPGDEYHEDE